MEITSDLSIEMSRNIYNWFLLKVLSPHLMNLAINLKKSGWWYPVILFTLMYWFMISWNYSPEMRSSSCLSWNASIMNFYAYVPMAKYLQIIFMFENAYKAFSLFALQQFLRILKHVSMILRINDSYNLNCLLSPSLIPTLNFFISLAIPIILKSLLLFFI